MAKLREYFADRIDCVQLGRAVILSGELMLEGEAFVSVGRLNCSPQRQCPSQECELLVSGQLPGQPSVGQVLES